MKVTADWLRSPAAQRVCRLLSDAGFQAYFVGGCVRNALLDAPVSDIDISTDATPEEVIRLAKRAGIKAVPTGIEHGTITVVVDDAAFEVTTFRRDVETDGRRAVVSFAKSIGDDAHRRDFTMNALYADGEGNILDPIGGLPDLVARRVRFIDDPEARIREDYLRILRFFRFHAWYGDDEHGLDRDGLAACAALVDGIDQLSKERIGQEMIKLLAANDPAPAVASMSMAGALSRVLPGAEAPGLAVLVHHEKALGLAPDPLRRLAVLGGESPIDNLRLSKAQSRHLQHLRSDLSPRELGYRLGATSIDVLAIRAAQVGGPVPMDDINAARAAIGQEFPVKAADLIPGYEGSALGQKLEELESRWIASDFKLSKEELLG